MTKLPRSTAILIAALLLLMVAVPAFAGDPPGRVLRLNYISGQVSFQPGGVEDWVAATINRPLTTADRVWTDKDSRAELNLGTASLRMDSETSLTVSNLSDRAVQVELDQGVLNIHVRRLYGDEIYEVDTPNVAFTLLKAGDYRFEVDPNGDTTTVIVRRGKGEGNGNGRGVEVRSGEMARFEHGNTLMHTKAGAPRPDGFDDWCQVRNQRQDKSDSFRYVSDDVIGYEDLDEYGYWRPVPTYGNVWVPRTVVVDWAPYRYGHWAWIEPWGWTWVDDAPWGFAPFHYGRWVYSSYGWGWCPGPRYYRPIYSPALVAWFGGPHWGVGLGFAGGYGVGWVPLGWGEPYYPYYRVSPDYVREVNIRNTHITNINYVTNNYTTIINKGGGNTNIINYANLNHGATTVPGGVLEHGRPVARSVVAVNDRDLKEARLMASADVAPRRGGVLGGRQDIPAPLPPSTAMSRRVITKMAPPERPDRFEDRQPFIERNHGMAVDAETMAEMKRNPAPANRGERGPNPGISATPAAPAGPATAEGGRVMGNEAGRPAAVVDNGKSGNAENSRSGSAVGRPIPRPPVNDKRVIDLEGGGAGNAGKGNPSGPGNGNANDNAGNSQRYVPRPPSERRPDSNLPGSPAMNSMRQEAGKDRAPESIARPVPRPTDGVKATAPQERRSPVFDRHNNAGDQPKAAEAEVATPRNVPRPPEGSQVRSDAEAGTFTRRPAPDATNDDRPAPPRIERRSTPDVGDRRPAPDNIERRSAPQPPEERRAAPETRSVPPERQPQEERRSAPPSEKQKSEAPQRSISSNYTKTPGFAESSRSLRVPRPTASASGFVVRESSYSPRGFSPPESRYSSRASSDRPGAGSYSTRYERSTPSYSRSTPSYSRATPSYSGSSGYSSGGGSRAYSAPRYSGSSGPRYSSSHAASSSSGGARPSSASRGSSPSGGSGRR